MSIFKKHNNKGYYTVHSHSRSLWPKISGRRDWSNQSFLLV